MRTFVGPSLQRGDLAAARQWLERAFDQRNRLIFFIVTDPAVDQVRNEPWFGDIVRRLGLDAVGASS